MKWEIFLDDCYYGLWCVRPEGDRDFNSPDNHHFKTQEEAEEYKAKMEKTKK